MNTANVDTRPKFVMWLDAQIANGDGKFGMADRLQYSMYETTTISVYSTTIAMQASLHACRAEQSRAYRKESDKSCKRIITEITRIFSDRDLLRKYTVWDVNAEIQF